LLSGSDLVDLTQAAQALGVDALDKASAQEAKSATGFSIGATPPFGLATKMRVAIDDHLLEFDHVWAAAGRPDAVMKINPQDLLRVSAAEVLVLRELSDGD
jgi:prolyl-tRNA editing enzyme YbaK/EbsC (Cys-tRNA(Pro) deacylase)